LKQKVFSNKIHSLPRFRDLFGIPKRRMHLFAIYELLKWWCCFT